MNNTLTHSFNVQVAIDHGVPEAIFIQNIEFWTRTNLANHKHIHDGLCWTFNKVEAFAKILPYYTPRQIDHLISKLVTKGLLIKGNYNKTAYDRTNWYAMTKYAYQYYKYLLTDENINIMNSSYPTDLGGNPYFTISQICKMEFTDMGNGIHRIVEPIPDIKTNNKKTDKILPTQIPEDFTFKQKHQDIANEFGLNLILELDSFKDYAMGANKKSSIVKQTDWDRTFANWLRNAAKWSNSGKVVKQHVTTITNSINTHPDLKPIPDKEDCMQALVRAVNWKEFSHPIIYLLFEKIGGYAIKHDTEVNMKIKIGHNYQDVCREYSKNPHMVEKKIEYFSKHNQFMTSQVATEVNEKPIVGMEFQVKKPRYMDKQVNG